MSSACHSLRPGGERSDDNDADADDLMSREDSPEAGEEENDNQEENINWHASSFYIGKFFIKQPDSTAKCSCTWKDVIKTKLGNTSGLDGHLMRRHLKVYELYKAKKTKKAKVDKDTSSQVNTARD